MKKNVFLTGRVQVGKSTIIKKYIEYKKPRLGGFVTLGEPWRADGSSGVYMFPAGERPMFDEKHIVFRRFGRKGALKGAELYLEKFETLGSALLSDENCAGCGLIIMDELGTREEESDSFHAAVLRRLESSLPVLGVVQARQSPFLDGLRARTDLDIITVDEANREAVFQRLKREFLIDG